MKLLTYSTRETNAQLGELIDEKVYAVNELDSSLPNQMEDFIQQSEENLTTLQKAYNNATSIKGFDLENVNLHAPIRKPGSVRDFMAFEEHLVNAYKRSGMKIPDDWYKIDRKSTRLNSSHVSISYAVFCLKKKKQEHVVCRPQL